MKTFPELLDEQLARYENLLPQADRSQGSMLWAHASARAALAWGLYKYMERVKSEALPSTAESPVGWAAEFGLTPKEGETDSQLLARLQARMRNPPAGGTGPDYVSWALEVEGIGDAVQHEGEIVGGVGVVQITLMGSPPGETVDEETRQAVYDLIMSRRPVGLYLLRVIPAGPIPYNVTLVGQGPNWNPVQCAADIEAYIKSLRVGDGVYIDQLRAIALANGCWPPPTEVLPDEDSGGLGPEQGLFDLPMFWRPAVIDVT